MIQARVSGGNFDDIARMLDVAAFPDFTPLAAAIAEVMVEDNREGLIAGTDSFGDPMTELRPSTIERGRGGDGPPLVPRYGASRAITTYTVRVEPLADRIRLIGGEKWPGWMGYHVTGTRHMPARDPADLRPAGQAKVATALEQFAETLLGGIL